MVQSVFSAVGGGELFHRDKSSSALEAGEYSIVYNMLFYCLFLFNKTMLTLQRPPKSALRSRPSHVLTWLEAKTKKFAPFV